MAKGGAGGHGKASSGGAGGASNRAGKNSSDPFGYSSGGAAGTSPNGAGQNGASSTGFTSGGGGGGGADGTFASVGGGNGGMGGDGGNGGGASTGGGGGGAGGNGLVINNVVSFDGNFYGGAGGAGGAGGYGVDAGGRAGNGGAGGAGGVGIVTTTKGVGSAYVYAGSDAIVAGGAGGAGGAGSTGNAQQTGRAGKAGAGGAGIVGANLTVVDNGTIRGGMSGDDATQADAITFTGGKKNSLMLGGTLDGGLGVSGTLTIVTNADTTLGNPIHDAANGAGKLVYAGASTLMLTGANTYTGGTTIDGGTVVAANVDDQFNERALGTGQIKIEGGGTLRDGNFGGGFGNDIVVGQGGGTIDDASGRTYVFGDISGTGTLSLTGSVIFLSGDNHAFSGVTAVTAGVELSATAASGLSARSHYTVDTGATLELRGINGSIGSLADGVDGGGTIISARVPQTLTTGSDNMSTSFSGTLQDGTDSEKGTQTTLALTKVGTGTFTLSGANTYTGGTRIERGTLALDHSTGGTIDAAGTGTIEVDGATLQLATAGTLTDALDLAGPTSTITATTDVTATLGGGLDVEASVLRFGSTADTGTLVFDASSVTGGRPTRIVIAGGTLQGAARSSALRGLLNDSGTTTQIAGGATLDLNGVDTIIAELAGAGTLTNTGFAVTTIDGGRFAGDLAGDALEVEFGGDVTLSGTSTSTSEFFVDAGATLSLTADASIDDAAGLTVNGKLRLFGTTVVPKVVSDPGYDGKVIGTGTLAGDGTGGGVQFVTNNLGRLTFTGDGDSFANALGGNGTIEFAGGSDTLEAGLKLRSRTLVIDGADVTLAGNQRFTRTFEADSGTLDLGGYGFSLARRATLDGTSIEGGGALLTQGTTIVSADTSIDARLGNSGTLQQRADLVFGSDGFFTNAAGATDQIRGNFDISAARVTNNAGLIEKTSGSGRSTISGPLNNTGMVEVASGRLALAGDVIGTGSLSIDGSGVLELGALISAHQTIGFGDGDGTLQVDAAGQFRATIQGFGDGDRIKLAGFDAMADVLYRASSTGDGGTLTVKEGDHKFSAHLEGTYDPNGFSLTNAAGGGAVVHYKG